MGGKMDSWPNIILPYWAYQGSVVRRTDSAIHWIAIFSTYTTNAISVYYTFREVWVTGSKLQVLLLQGVSTLMPM